MDSRFRGNDGVGEHPFDANDATTQWTYPMNVRGRNLLFLLLDDEGFGRLPLLVQGETYN